MDGEISPTTYRLGPHAEALLQSALSRRQQAHFAAQQADAEYLAAIRAVAELAGVPQAELEIQYRLVAPAPVKPLEQPVAEDVAHADQ